MSKTITYGESAKAKLLQGIRTLETAVSSTLGAKGTNVLIESPFIDYPHVTKDGVTVARNIAVNDPEESQGVKLMKHLALMVNKEVGDGTTTSIVLGRAIIEHGIKSLKEVKSINNVQLRQGIDDAVEWVNNYLKENSKKVESSDDILKVATISANNDPVVGQLITKAFGAVGEYGSIRTAASLTKENYYEVESGMKVDGGIITPMLMPTNQSKVVLKNPYILVSDSAISSLNSIFTIPEVHQAIVGEGRGLVIMCGEMETNLLQQVIVLNKRDNKPVYVVKAPSFGADRTKALTDLAVYTDASYVGGNSGIEIMHVKGDDLGAADEVIIEEDSVTFVGGYAENDDVQVHIAMLKDLLDNPNEDREEVEKRLGMFSNGIATIYLDATSEVEFEETSYRVEDAINAVRVAKKHGITDGGGVALLRAYYGLENEELSDDKSDSYRIGWTAVYNALLAPFHIIMRNAGVEDQLQIVDEFILNEGMGYDVLSDKIVNMNDEGIIDPVYVTQTALEAASKVAGIILTTSCVITTDPIDASL